MINSPNSVQRMEASRLALLAFVAQWRLAPTAHAGRSAAVDRHERGEYEHAVSIS
jgi:hypothetical protein